MRPESMVKAKLQALTNVVDEIGQPVEAWTDVAEIGADIRHLSGIESVKAGAEASIVKASIRIRYRDGVTAGMRILHGSKAYEIKAPLPDLAKKQYIDLVCEAVS